MALFEFEDGHLVPAQFGYPVSYDLGPELVDAICQQVLQIVSRPLFPVTWRDMTGQDDEETPRLTALDVTGQIVSVEILKLLDSETLITSLSRLAIVASLSWSDLAGEYPTGSEGFRAGWAQFRDSMPPAVGPGPRLIMVAGEIDPSVRPALSILATSGVEVHLMNLRQMSNGRLFLDVNAVGPRLYGHAPQLLGSVAGASAIAAGPAPAPAVPEAPVDSEELEAAAEENLDDAAQAIPELPVPPVTDADAEADGDGDAEDATESETPTTRPTPKIAPRLRDAFHYSVDEEPPAPWKSKDSPEEQSDEAGAGSDELVEEFVEEFVEEETEIDDRVDEAADAVEADDADQQVEEDHDAADEHATEAFDDAEESIESEGETDGSDEREQVETLDEEERHDEERDRGEAAAGDAADDAAADDNVDAEDAHPEEHAVHVGDELDDNEQGETGEQRWERPAHLGSRASRRAHVESAEDLNDGGATDAAMASSVDHEEESLEVIAAREGGVPVLGRDKAGLRTLAQILGEDTPLVARGELGLPDDLVLAASGAISCAGLTYPSLETMLTARGMGHIDVWSFVRIGDRLGPTLAEALDEVNREIVREYANVPRGRRVAKH